MATNWKDVARACLEGAESGVMTFPQIVKTLIEASFDGYSVDFRRAAAADHLPDGGRSSCRRRGARPGGRKL